MRMWRPPKDAREGRGKLKSYSLFVGHYFLSGNPAPIGFAGTQGKILEVVGNCAYVLIIMQHGAHLNKKTLIPLEKMSGFTFYESMEAMTPDLRSAHTEPRPPMIIK